jgi:tetrahydromethanopterin S-methyltransferase subunit D
MDFDWGGFLGGILGGLVGAFGAAATVYYSLRKTSKNTKGKKKNQESLLCVS